MTSTGAFSSTQMVSSLSMQNTLDHSVAEAAFGSICLYTNPKPYITVLMKKARQQLFNIAGTDDQQP